VGPVDADTFAPGRGGTDQLAAAGATVVAWLATREIAVVGTRAVSPADSALGRLALVLGDNYPTLAELHAAIRHGLMTGREVRLDLSRRRAGEVATITHACRLLNRHALLSAVQYDPGRGLLIVTPQRLGAAVHFFTGGWFERYVAQRAVMLAVEAGVIVDRLENARLRLPDGRATEVDLLLVAAGRLVWVECTTGPYQPVLGRCADLRCRLGLPGERAILVVLGLPEELAIQLTALYPLTIVSERMLPAALQNGWRATSQDGG
jgi:hypothetical protein